jgi:hypothetical protein
MGADTMTALTVVLASVGIGVVLEYLWHAIRHGRKDGGK